LAVAVALMDFLRREREKAPVAIGQGFKGYQGVTSAA
jgi:hypothetical protein